MAKEIYLYGYVTNESAENFMREINSAEENKEDIVIRINSGGGQTEAMYGMIAKFAAFPGNKTVKVDGSAKSAAAHFALFADNVEALEQSNFLLHRAAYPRFIETNAEYFTDAMKKILSTTNDSIRSEMEKKLDVVKFQKITKTSMDEVFSMDDRVDIVLTAKEAQKIGLVKTINKVSPSKIKEMNAQFSEIAASFDTKVDLLEEISEIVAIDEKTQIKKMNKGELKEKHPELFNEVLALGKSQETERVTAWSKLAAVDAEASTKGISSGLELSASEAIDITLKAGEKATAAAAVLAAAGDNAPVLDTDKPEEGAEEATAILPGSKYITTKTVKE